MRSHLPERSLLTGPGISSFAWWAARRRRYNGGLIAAGTAAFIIYVIVGLTLLPLDEEFEITAFTLLFQGVGYLVMMGIANVCYYLGPISERLISPKDPEQYRDICYELGFWASVLLPFSVPALLAVSALASQPQ